MRYTQHLLEELNILVRYSLSSAQEGLKIHASSAAPEIVAAAQRLFDKGLISQADGGYLTHLGNEAAEQAHKLLNLLNPE
jgi:uncharacterized protein (TIGR02647 family)